MDCGPAALAAMLRGCGIDVSYPRLREACQTDVDGTSIDTLEELTRRFGLDAEQVMLPNDFLLDTSNGHLPCIAVVTLPNGLTHFVVIWRAMFGWFEIMDPARGRAWMRRAELESVLYRHQLDVAAEDWFDYARSAEFAAALRAGCAELAIDAAAADEIIARAFAGDDWHGVAVLDAAIRMCRSLRGLGERIRGERARALIEHAMTHPDVVPQHYHQVSPGDANDSLKLRGAVVLKVTGSSAEPRTDDAVIAKTLGGRDESLVVRVRRELDGMGFRHLGLRLAAFGLTMGALTFVEALVFRYLLGFQPPSELWIFALVLAAVLLPSVGAFVGDLGQTAFGQMLGRQLETRIRMRLQRKLPSIRDDYFASRLVSDLAERGNAIAQLRESPAIAIALAMNLVRLVMILTGLCWLMSNITWVVLLTGSFAIVAPLAMFRTLAERDLRARTHLGALSGLYLDALRGTEPIWTHGAARSLALEHESLLLRWARATRRMRSAASAFEAVQIFVLGGCGIALVLGALHRGLPQGSVLLVAYWALFVPMLSRGLLNNLKQLPAIHNIVARVFEVLDAPEEELVDAPAATLLRKAAVKLEFENVCVARGGRPVLADLDLAIAPGERVAIVGASGSGKSSFLGAISGWHAVSSGRVLIDDVAADALHIQALREDSTLVDPETYLWNRELYANVLYGLDADAMPAVDSALDDSELLADLGKMPDGLATHIGENGSRLSGGESQRLRIARALVHEDARLVLLDEPFAGMDADQRLRMHARVLERWPEATLLWVSHHVRETLTFARVLVFEGGRVVEDGAPQDLLRQASRYAAMVDSEIALEQRLHGAPWRTMAIDAHTSNGREQALQP